MCCSHDKQLHSKPERKRWGESFFGTLWYQMYECTLGNVKRHKPSKGRMYPQKICVIHYLFCDKMMENNSVGKQTAFVFHSRL